ncbi:putative single-stranded DNA-binding protein 68k chain [Venustampulla echinocandica]|uniref:Replication protein A subunit n=1 Tax=Venustampulla echinocandica TaxID=2656787 RepID=A0A370TQQ8_9HELO|nr:putative single-stranded DNA-binding protein 68k chain [Venustampulla echinocandica]RDL37865.1 putative single-stranded DNA-binding protein 68k chain [Venustampulla echinocandica]
MADAAQAQISRGALNAIFNDPDNVARNFPVPICQCVQIKALGSTGENPSERYRLVLSDVDNFVQSMLATQANHVVHDGKLKKGSIVRLKSWQANEVKGKRILIVLDLEVIESLGELEKIGDPVALPARDEEAKPVNTTIGGTRFYGNDKPQPAAPRAASRTVPTSSASGSHGTIHPIEALSPYGHKWTIKARVTNKSEIRTWHKASSEGKLFSVNLLDESGEIKATGFNNECDALYDVFQEGSVYYISTPCRVQLARKQFSNIPNDYELTFEKDTLVEKAEDQENVPQVRYNFTTIGQLQDIDKDSTIDVIGVLKEVAEVNQIESKSTGKGYDKRDLTLVDDSGFSVRLTIWGKTATAFDTNPESIVAFKGAKVSDFNGRSLSLLSSGSMSLDPDIPEAHKLKGWYDSQGRSESFATHTNMASAGAAGGRQDQTKTISQVRDENLGMSEKDDYFSVKATIVFIKQDSISYPACLSENCNKKVTELPDGTWRCEKCEIAHPRPQHRYIMTLNVADHTGQLYLSCFDDVGRLVMGMDADQLNELKENDAEGAQKAFDDANCKTLFFRCRARMDTYNDQQRVRYQVLSAAPIDFKSEARKLTELIKLYNID